MVLEGICIMFQIAPAKVGEAGKKTDDYWSVARFPVHLCKNAIVFPFLLSIVCAYFVSFGKKNIPTLRR
jgi:hypothetical protein